MPRILVLCLCALLLGGCQTGHNADPSQGGLFSYSPEAYKQRAAQRQERLKMLQREQIAEEQQKAALTQTAAEKKAAHAKAQQQLRQAGRSITNLKKQLETYKATNEVQQAALTEMLARRAVLEGDLKTLGNGSGADPAVLQVEAERLRREVERLTNDAEALSAI